MARILKLFALAALVLGSGHAAAARPEARASMERIEASMLVTGEIDIEADGSVSDYRPDQGSRLPPAVVQLLQTAVLDWQFEPVVIEGTPTRVQSRANILVQARKAEDGNYLLGITRASFGSHEDEDVPTAKRLPPPKYPTDLARAGIGGTVYLVLKLARDGSIADVMVEQVNLKALVDESLMQRMRDQLARASLAGTRRWKFNPPAKPDDAPHWVVRVPVEFVAPDARLPRYGEWSSYSPGPQSPVPWVDAEDMGAPDTLVAGGVYSAGNHGPKLLTPLGSPGG